MSVAASVDKQIVQLPETKFDKLASDKLFIARQAAKDAAAVAAGKLIVQLPEPGADNFSHNANKADKENGKIPEKIKKDLTKTKLCDYFRRGNCGAGDNCPFAHHLSELRSAPNLAKTSLCAPFEQGKCVKGDKCTYAHGLAELVKPPSYKKKMCVWHKDGKCRHGVKCGFAHSVSELDEESQALRKEFFNQKKKEQMADAGGKKAASEFDDEASTAVPDSSLADSNVSMRSRAPVPGEHVFRMAAGSGSAPSQHQVQSMRLAIGDLETKLAQIQDQAMQSTVDEMKGTIKMLSQQCEEVEAALRTTNQANRLQRIQSAQGKKVQRIPGSTPSGLQMKPTLWAQLSHQCRDNTAVRAALGVLVLAMMVMIEVGLR